MIKLYYDIFVIVIIFFFLFFLFTEITRDKYLFALNLFHSVEWEKKIEMKSL